MKLFIRSEKGYIGELKSQKQNPGTKIAESRAWRSGESGRFIELEKDHETKQAFH